MYNSSKLVIKSLLIAKSIIQNCQKKCFNLYWNQHVFNVYLKLLSLNTIRKTTTKHRICVYSTRLMLMLISPISLNLYHFILNLSVYVSNPLRLRFFFLSHRDRMDRTEADYPISKNLQFSRNRFTLVHCFTFVDRKKNQMLNDQC